MPQGSSSVYFNSLSLSFVLCKVFAWDLNFCRWIFGIIFNRARYKIDLTIIQTGNVVTILEFTGRLKFNVEKVVNALNAP